MSYIYLFLFWFTVGIKFLTLVRSSESYWLKFSSHNHTESECSSRSDSFFTREMLSLKVASKSFVFSKSRTQMSKSHLSFFNFDLCINKSLNYPSLWTNMIDLIIGCFFNFRKVVFFIFQKISLFYMTIFFLKVEILIKQSFLLLATWFLIGI